jgi:hypothetical protein
VSLRRARGLAAALAVLLAAFPGDGAAREPDLAAQVNEFIAWRLARARSAARRPEARAKDPLARTVSPATLDQERAWLRAFRARLDAGATPMAGTPDAAADERAMLNSAVRYDSLELEVLKPFVRDPAAYLDLIAESVRTALDRTAVSPCQRVQLAILRLDEAPEVLRTARVNLVNPPRLLTERAMVRARALLSFYRSDLPGKVPECRAPHLQAALAEADTLAVRAVRDYIVYLERDLLPASHGELAIGPEACERLLSAMLMGETPPVDSLLAQAARDVDARRAELDSLAAIVSPSGARAVLDSLSAATAWEHDPVAAGRQALERVRDFLRTSDLVTLPGKLNLNVRKSLAIDPPDHPALAAADAGEPRDSPAWLGIAPADRFGRFELDLALANEVMPGRLMRELAAGGEQNRLGRVMSDAWPGRDWGLYCERSLIDAGYGSRESRYRLVFATRALEQAGRSLVSLGLHAGTMSEPEARQILAERCLFDSSRVERELQWAASDAGLMGYTIAAQRLLELQEEAWRRLGPRFQTRSFNDAVLRCGVAPCGYVRTRVWHELAVAAGKVPVGAKP